jgi:hypothetical protein
MTNPYTPPNPEPDSNAMVRLSRPAKALVIMASVHGVFAASILTASAVLWFGGDLASGQFAFLALILLHLVLLLGIAVGASRMARLRSLGAARAAAIISCVPVLSPLIVVGIPFGIWSLRLLANPQIRAAFPTQFFTNSPQDPAEPGVGHGAAENAF